MMSQMMKTMLQLSLLISDILQIIFFLIFMNLSFMTLILSFLQIFVVIFNLLNRNKAIEKSYKAFIEYGLTGNYIVILTGYIVSTYIINEYIQQVDTIVFYTFYKLIINLNIFSSSIYCILWMVC